MTDPFEQEREERGVNSGIDGEPDEIVFGDSTQESEADSRLQQLLASAHTVYCTIHLIDYMRGRSPLIRSKRDMKVEGS